VIEALLQAERLLVHGQVDQAEQIYAGAVAQDPNNAIAVVGLARVALERGDEQLAYERALEALGIDPQNAAAQRLAARLAEVFAARAQPVPVPAESRADEPRPSEQAVFNRNPSMADHAAAEERREAQAPHASPVEARGRPEDPPNVDRRTGLWRRILGG
jgi:thioredoxin-like negative regulator of GroEL